VLLKNFKTPLPKFFEILPKFLTNQNFGGAVLLPAHTVPTPLVIGVKKCIRASTHSRILKFEEH